jgi:hypothetical protein
MPKQETYFEKTLDSVRVAVIKSYDAKFAREAFDVMDDGALAFLGQSLVADGKLEAVDESSSSGAEYIEMLWEGVEEGAREEWNTVSYFVVLTGDLAVYVSSDWPSAEAYANRLTESVTSGG